MPSQPSLIDRLTLGTPASPSECLKRDLAALLSAAALASSRDLSRWPHVSRSVLNYGVSGFTGRMLTNADIPEIERNITRAIQRFEPRLDPHSVEVTVLADSANSTAEGWPVRIVAQRSAMPGKLPLEFWAVVDAQSGHLHMSD